MTRLIPKDAAESLATILDDVANFQASMTVLEETSETTSRLLELIAKYKTRGKRIHDTNIVATMLSADVKSILTNNLSDFKNYSELVQIIPLNTILSQ